MKIYICRQNVNADNKDIATNTVSPIFITIFFLSIFCGAVALGVAPAIA